MHVSRIYRLLRLITLLQSGRQMTPDELAEELEVSRRTVSRDLNVLEMAKIPYFYDPDRKGYRINDNFFLPPVNLNLSEALSVMVLANRVKRSGKVPLLADAAKAAMKIESSLPSFVRKHIGGVLESMSMRIGPVADHDQPGNVFDDLVGAIGRNRICRLVYNSFTEGEEIRLKLRPYRIAFFRRAWYVFEHSDLHGEVRTFKVSRIRRLSVSAETFETPEAFDLDDHLGKAWCMIPEGREYDVHLRFAPKVAGNVAEVIWHSTQRVEMNEDGSANFHARVDGLGEIGWWVLGYGDQVEVLAPKALRRRVRDTAGRMAQRNSDPPPAGKGKPDPRKR